MALLVSCGGGGESTGTGDNGPATEGVRISGSITNLLGDGLVMQLNGGRDISPAGTHTQFFFVNVPKRTNYTITVHTQPTNPWQTCVVAGGTGVATADNASATLTCTTNRYAVRGTISGLTGGGFALRINGGNPQAIAPGSTTFAFPDIASGASFTVAIASQPAGQTCTINAADGRVAGGDFTAVTVACGAEGFTLGGDYIFGGSTAVPTFRLNGAPAVSFGPGVDAPPFPTFMFPTALRPGDRWSVVVASQPQNANATCTLLNAKGRMPSANVTSMQIQCFQYGAFEGLEGAFTTTVENRRQYITFWADGTYNTATRLDNTCANNGNGVEYGAYRRLPDGTFKSRAGRADTNGECGLNNPNVPFSSAPSGRLTRNGNTLSLKLPDDTLTVLTLDPVPQVAGSLVGAWVRADGVDGTLLVFHADGTYLALESQTGVNLNMVPGYERGCYVLGGGTFTATVGAGCTPDGRPSLDGNRQDGGFAGRGAIAFVLTGAATATIDGQAWRRMVLAP